MSAFVPDRNEIWYLVKAAETYRPRLGFSYYWNGKRHEIADIKDALRIAQMLWDEALHAVCIRYPDGEIPGPIDEDFIIREEDHGQYTWYHIDPVQVLKSCAYYEYQACEDPEYHKSEARAFIEALRHRAIQALPGYEEAIWGAPEPWAYMPKGGVKWATREK